MAEHEAKVEGTTFALLAAVEKAAGKAKVSWMVTGAWGRVLLLESVYGLPPGRATEDLDFAVMVESWGHFARLVADICLDPQFTQDSKQAQRLRYGSHLYMDLVPFGGVQSQAGTIAWPPRGEMVMSVTGFHDAMEDAVRVRVNDAIVVPVASPAGLLMLKLLVWPDRRLAQPRRDSADIAYFLRHAASLITETVLFENHFDAVSDADYDLDLAACFVLGERIRTIASPATRERIAAVLEPLMAEGVEASLVRDVASALPAFGEGRVMNLLLKLRSGFEAMNP